ncbi:MAG: DUF1427 family protein [Elusimicrobiaceae bacterium]|nr:DUF1427 family protein [Elusimicrobiaceae bacterium]MBP3513239.1 DUF1427 family protein [Elusimicrobiaceae bacterium]
MLSALYSLITGIGVGLLFAFLKFPIPAPNHINGVLGILGIFLGYLIIDYFRKG